MTMTVPTILTGAILVALGVYGYTTGTPNPDTGAVSPTALIPAGFGVALLLLGLLVAAKPGVRKHAMHGAAMIGVLGFLGGFAPVVRGAANTGSVDFGKPAVQNGLAMAVVCLVFVGLCVKSFVAARKARAVAV